MPTKIDTISGKPSKAFFIDMITRDLSITDCILDLIDNSIDNAVERSKADVMKTLTNGGQAPTIEGTVSLKSSPDKFVIEDTCGGISIKDARDTVFLFGNPEERGAPGGLSVYGIGMKRAFFKLGRKIRVDSVTAEDWFRVDIDVAAWEKKGDDDWDFQFSDKGIGKGGHSDTPGTRIQILDLRDEVRASFRQEPFPQQLLDKIGMTYSLFIKAGLQLCVNERPVESALPPLGGQEKITPARKMITHDGVDILIIAGVTEKEDKEPHGWYIFCNGRMVLEAEKTELTGWGTNLPMFHSKYNHFVGYVYFKSDDATKLPWTTTKRGIVLDSPVYQTTLAEMQLQARPVLNFLNKMYPGDVMPEGIVEREVLEKTKNVSIDQIPRVDSTFRVDTEAEKKKEENKEINIHYKKKKKDIDLIRTCSPKLSKASASKIGEYTFDYFMTQECK